MTRIRIALLSSFFLLSSGAALAAQTLEEVCPNSEDGTGALWGLLSDTDAEMGLPGATVRATGSTSERSPQRASRGMPSSTRSPSRSTSHRATACSSPLAPFTGRGATARAGIAG